MVEDYMYSEDYLLAECSFWQDVYTNDMVQKARTKRDTKSCKARDNRYKNILLDFLKSDNRVMKLTYATSDEARNPYYALRSNRKNNADMFGDITIKKQKECIILRKKPSLYA